MGLYIEKNALDAFLEKQLSNCHNYHGNKKEIYQEAILAVKSFAKTSNCTDAVPVVHCKDCKHKRDSKDAFDWDGVTPLCECDYSKMVNRGYEFCSWGERKTD